MHMTRQGAGQRPRKKTTVLSPQGRRAIRVVAGLRLLGAGATTVTLIMLGAAFGEHLAGEGVATWRWWVALAAAALAAVFAGLEISRGGAEARAEEKRIRAKLLRTAFTTESLPGGGDQESEPAGLIQLLTDNAERLTEYRQVYLGGTLAALAIPFLVLGVIAVVIDPVVGLVTMALCPLVPVLVWLFMRFFRATSATSRIERAKLSGRYLDAIRNLVPIRLLGAGERVEAQLRAQGEANRGAIMKLLAGNQLVIIVLDGLFSLVLICATTALAVARLGAGAIDVGQALTVVFLTILLIEPLSQLAGFFYIGMGGMASERAIGRYLGAHASRGDRTGSQAGAPAAAEESDASCADAIRLEGVRFDHGRGEVLCGVDLVVARGRKVAIVGRSGAGKSTLLSLLRGSLPVQEGAIRIDGRDIGDLEPSRIRELAATVSQTTWLFTGTIADNLRLARPDATDEELWEALRRAQLADEVERMPGGLLTDVGERGAMLSGGQAQRISLARALLSGRRILLLDEPTSQVDMASEARIITALADIGADHTVLVATHRRALLEIADVAHEMRDGVLTPIREGALR